MLKLIGFLLLSQLVIAGPLTGGLAKLGVNSDVDIASVPEDVWSSGAYSFPSAAAATTILSTDVSDSGGASGARTVKVIGLDSSYNIIDEDVSLQGTLPVTLSNQFYRVNGMKVLTAGVVGTNSGALQLKHSSTIIGEIPSSYGQAPMAIYTTTKPGRITGWSVSVYGLATASVGTFKLQVKDPSGAWRTVGELGANTVGTSSVSQTFDQPVPVPAHADIRIRVTAMSADNTSVSAKFDLEEDVL